VVFFQILFQAIVKVVTD